MELRTEGRSAVGGGSEGNDCVGSGRLEDVGRLLSKELSTEGTSSVGTGNSVGRILDGSWDRIELNTDGRFVGRGSDCVDWIGKLLKIELSAEGTSCVGTGKSLGSKLLGSCDSSELSRDGRFVVGTGNEGITLVGRDNDETWSSEDDTGNSVKMPEGSSVKMLLGRPDMRELSTSGRSEVGRGRDGSKLVGSPESIELMIPPRSDVGRGSGGVILVEKLVGRLDRIELRIDSVSEVGTGRRVGTKLEGSCEMVELSTEGKSEVGTGSNVAESVGTGTTLLEVR